MFNPYVLDDLFRHVLEAPPVPCSLQANQVIFNPPATVIYWNDGTKTVAMCSDQDTFSEEFGFAMACAKKLFHPYDKLQEQIQNAYRPQQKAKAKVATKNTTEAATVSQDAPRPRMVTSVGELFSMLANNKDIPSNIVIKFSAE